MFCFYIYLRSVWYEGTFFLLHIILNTTKVPSQFRVCVEFFIRSVPISGILPDHVWSLVDLWLDVDVCFRFYIWDEERQWRSHTFSPTSHPNFFRPLLHLFVFWLVESSIICKSMDYATVRSPFVTLLQTNKTKRCLLCLWTTIVLRDVLIVALGVHVIVVLTWCHL